MTKTLKLKNPDPDVLVTLGAGDNEHQYRLQPQTKAVDEALDACAEAIDKATMEQNTPARTKAVAEQLDHVLHSPGKAPKPSKVVLDAYDAGETTHNAIATLVQEIVEAGRPT